MALYLESRAFANGEPIPAKYTCDGENVSPPLTWADVPAGTKSLALIVDDPDAPDPAAPQRTFVHWVLYNIPPDSRELTEHVSDASLPDGAREGLNDWHRVGFAGPCPPTGRHRYFHKLYALDTVLDELPKADKAALETAMQDHMIDSTELVGTFQN